MLAGGWLKPSQQDGEVGSSQIMQGLVAIVCTGICCWHSGELGRYQRVLVKGLSPMLGGNSGSRKTAGVKWLLQKSRQEVVVSDFRTG